MENQKCDICKKAEVDKFLCIPCFDDMRIEYFEKGEKQGRDEGFEAGKAQMKQELSELNDH